MVRLSTPGGIVYFCLALCGDELRTRPLVTSPSITVSHEKIEKKDGRDSLNPLLPLLLLFISESESNL